VAVSLTPVHSIDVGGRRGGVAVRHDYTGRYRPPPQLTWQLVSTGPIVMWPHAARPTATNRANTVLGMFLS